MHQRLMLSDMRGITSVRTPVSSGGRSAAVDRREFLLSAINGGLAVSGLAAVSRLHAAELAPAAASLIAGKDLRLNVLSETPLVLETPLEALGAHRVTPKELLFVRNNQDLAGSATLQPASASDGAIEFTGLVDASATVTAADLLAFDEQVEHEMVLQCSGNGRSLFSRTAQTKGTQWGRGGVANVRFAGVPLAAVIEKLGVKVQPQARFLAAEGRDHPPAGQDDFEHSLPLEEALTLSFLALRLNGEPLPAIHGGPVRLVTPGYYATMNVKWLSRLRFEQGESTNYNHLPRYRTPVRPIEPGAAITYTLANSRPTWRMKLATIVFSPIEGARLPAGELEIRGVAFNDGRAKIESVLVSLDEGRSWRPAQLDVPDSPYAWYPWRLRASFPRGRHTLWARAVDALGRSQPLDGSIFWNPSGYEWNGAEKLLFTTREA